MSHRKAGPCGYADGLALLVSGMLRGSRGRSSSHLKDFFLSLCVHGDRVVAARHYSRDGGE